MYPKHIVSHYTTTPINGITYEYILVNTSGKIVDGKSKSKDGNDYYYVTSKKNDGTNSINAIYVED